jgi:hypothetical protein
LGSARLLNGQSVPARDLLEFPVGTAAEAPLLSTLSRDGIWNPASILLPPLKRVRVVAAALDSPSEQGVVVQSLALAFSLGEKTAFGVSALRASVANLVRTEEDPQSIGSDIPYATQLLSASIARRLSDKLDAGVAVRYHRGHVDNEARSALVLDAGVLVHSLGKRDVRVGAATFVNRANFQDAELANTRLSVAVDARVLGTRDEMQMRAGYSFAASRGLGNEHYASISGRMQALEVNGGLLSSRVHGGHTQRTRLGVALRSATVTVGLAQEQNFSGISPTYEVVIPSTIGR